MNSNGFEKVEFNFNCNFDLDEEDVNANESDPLALVHDSSFSCNDGKAKDGKMVISSTLTSLPVNVNNKTQNASNKSNLECNPQRLKRAALTPLLTSSPRKRLVTVIPKPRPQLHHHLAKIQTQADTTINSTRASTITTTPPVQIQAPASLSSSTVSPSTSQNSIVLQPKIPPESQSNNTSHARKMGIPVNSPIHTNNTNDNNSSRLIVNKNEPGLQIPIIKSVTSLQPLQQQQQQAIIKNGERPLVQSKNIMTTTNPTTRLIAHPPQLNNFVPNPRLSLTSLLAAAKKPPPLVRPPFTLAPSTLGRPPGPGPSSILVRNNNNLPPRPLSHVERINAANNNHPIRVNYTQNNNDNSESSNSWKYFKCEQCHKSFWQEILLTEHMKKHNPHKPYKCTECDRSYLSKSLLALHLETHSSFKTFKCNLCSQTFRREASLNLHIKGHDGIFPYSCAMCEKTFLRSGSLRIHQLNTHQVVLPLDANDDVDDDKDSS